MTVFSLRSSDSSEILHLQLLGVSTHAYSYKAINIGAYCTRLYCSRVPFLYVRLGLQHVGLGAN